MNWSGGCEARSITGHFQFQLHNKHQARPRKLQHLGDVSEQIGRGTDRMTRAEGGRGGEGNATGWGGRAEIIQSGKLSERDRYVALIRRLCISNANCRANKDLINSYPFHFMLINKPRSVRSLINAAQQNLMSSKKRNQHAPNIPVLNRFCPNQGHNKNKSLFVRLQDSDGGMCTFAQSSRRCLEVLNMFSPI